ncbi:MULTISPECIES: YbjN domain-containing protein [Amycolatopsis]|uniref:YbjN domain-containing protein n=1 Tax=Amycolatopsis thermalba TaxID=944492 RepID=A0ABY4NTI2_9PSEU|nr:MULTISPECIES: YbjN domain-containing protein [Amycolatopsis]OXM66180.1 hypothetical protein CF166_27555 [Amycolatopsis sp. KNN50.9b]UQS23360.1 YbjN domain-containing protein [Amycolatopsis thermalba]
MTTDPSPVPDLVVPDQGLVEQLLDQIDLKHALDEDGDLGAAWEHYRIYFLFRGEQENQTYAVRAFYDRPHAIEHKPMLLEAIDDWNRRTLFPKVYTHTDDDGTVRLIGEESMLIGTGVALEHFVNSTVSWIRASMEFDKWLVEHLGLAADLDGDSKPDDE